MISGGNRDRLANCIEEFFKYTIKIRLYFALFGDRCSEREDRTKNVQNANESETTVKRKQGEVNGVQVSKI